MGLRPGRAPLRLDAEVLSRRNGAPLHVVHCYGHGGSGVTLGMGCAQDVLEKHVKPLLSLGRKQVDGRKLSSWFSVRSKL